MKWLDYSYLFHGGSPLCLILLTQPISWDSLRVVSHCADYCQSLITTHDIRWVLIQDKETKCPYRISPTTSLSGTRNFQNVFTLNSIVLNKFLYGSGLLYFNFKLSYVVFKIICSYCTQILQIEIPEPNVNGTKACLYHEVFLYFKHFESKSNVVFCCCRIRDQRGERVSAKVNNNESYYGRRWRFRYSWSSS